MDELTKRDLLFGLVVIVGWVISLFIIYKDIQKLSKNNNNNNGSDN